MLMDVTNSQELGMIVRTEPLRNDTTRIQTTLTTVNVRGDCIVRGRFNGRGLYGAHVMIMFPIF
jgi:hypothetical protein